MKLLIILILLITQGSNSFAADNYLFNHKKATPSASFDSIWVDYDVTENGVYGMRIHLNFSTYGMKDVEQNSLPMKTIVE